MEKISKISLTMLVLMLSIFVAAGTASAFCQKGLCAPDNCFGCCYTGAGAPDPCPLGATCCYECGDLVMYSCGFDADLEDPVVGCAPPPAPRKCTTRHGLIVGAVNITINGNGFMIQDGGVANRNCDVLMLVDPSDECALHPCRQATDGGVIDSGIVNANTLAHNSCNLAAPVGQGGCDNVTIKDVEIKGFCDGIFMSGDCSNGAAHPNPKPDQIVGAGANSEYRLTGLLIEGCCIHDNGKDCGSCDGSNCGYANKCYNDGIFLAEVGINSTDGTWENIPCDPPAEDPCDGTSGPNPPAEVENVIVRHNKISNQKGCCCESCPGGNCINLNGGMEEPVGHECWYSGCSEIAKNVCKNTGCSCVQFHHGTDKNYIHGNYCMGNRYAGIGTGCDWLNENYVYSNWVKDAGGPGIGVNAGTHIYNNFSLDNYDTIIPCTNFPDEGYGILVTGGDTNSCVMDNTCAGNQTADIADPAGLITAASDRNMCQTTGNYADANPGPRGKCRYDGGDRLNCKADLNHDCRVNDILDLPIFVGELGQGSAYCCPCPW